MRIRFFAIPTLGGEAAADDLNRFLASHRVAAIDRALVQDRANSFWAISVTVVQTDSRPHSAKKESIDYKSVLSDSDFTIFAKLRSLRKTLADQEGVPAYALFTNEQLADMARSRVTTASGLREIQGVGDARVRKYGEAFIGLLRTEASAALPPNGDDG